MRKPFIAGNWKMNNTVAEGLKLIEDLKPLVAGANAEVAVCVPYTLLSDAGKAVKGTNIKLGAENMHFEDKGAFTGEISADMLLELGVEYVIIGHSERRQYFAETDATCNKKIKKALEKGLKVILCVGESLEERESGVTEQVIKTQILGAFDGVEATDLADKIVIAYEPVWAIGTGKTATSEQANETIGYIRKLLIENVCKVCGGNIRIQYGGSMNTKNVKELMAMPEIDGGLIGGASLKANDFAFIVNYDK